MKIDSSAALGCGRTTILRMWDGPANRDVFDGEFAQMSHRLP
jgi:hypothetical protein